MFLSEDENFLLLFRQETPLDSSVGYAGEHLVVASVEPGSQACHGCHLPAHSPSESCPWDKTTPETLGVEPGLWPAVSMCSLSGLT